MLVGELSTPSPELAKNFGSHSQSTPNTVLFDSKSTAGRICSSVSMRWIPVQATCFAIYQRCGKAKVLGLMPRFVRTNEVFWDHTCPGHRQLQIGAGPKNGLLSQHARVNAHGRRRKL